MKIRKYIIFGEVLWDVFPDKRVLGGAPLNFAYYCSKYEDTDINLISALGDDTIGKETVQKVKDLGLKTDFISSNSFPTGRVTIEMKPDRTHDFIIHENSAWDKIRIEHEWYKELQDADIIYFGTLAQRSETNRLTLKEIFRSGKNAFTIFDLNLRQHFYSQGIIENSLDNTSLFKLNDEEWITIKNLLELPKDDDKAIEKLFDKYNLQYICITMGPEGAKLFLPDGKHFYKNAKKVDIVDTVGCGDAFISWLSNSLIRGEDEETALNKAIDLAAQVAQNPGAIIRAPKEEE